jgi:hypothetical protein
MNDEVMDYSGQAFNEFALKLQDLEEKQRILKDRVILIGENFIETKEETNLKILELKKEIQILRSNTERMISFIETMSSEFSNFARKEDIEILTKQAKMFQPLEFVRKSDIKEKQ